MNTRDKTLAIGIVFLAAWALLALAAGLTHAQGAGPGQTAEDQPRVVAAGAPGAIPVQGRLTDASGAPLNGVYTMTFRLYEVASGGTPVCGDTRLVTVANGLFSDYMDGCYTDVNGQRLWLGVKVGNDAEMTPRQLLMPVPYALSLVPDAAISGTTGSTRPILHLENWATTGRGLRSYAMATSGENYGVIGASRSPDGYGGYYYNNDGGVGLYGKGNPGVIGVGYGAGGANGVLGRAGAFAAGVKGEGNISSYGGWFTSTDFVALYITSNREDNTNALVLDGAKDGGIDFNVTSDGDVKQALASNGLVKAAVYARCNSTESAISRSFNNASGASITIANGTSGGACVIDLGFDVFDRYFVATALSNQARGVSCNTEIAHRNQLSCLRWDAAGNGSDGMIMVLVY